MIGSVFYHLTPVCEGKNIQVKVIQSNQGILLIQSNQVMGLIKSNQYIQSWNMGRCPISTYGNTLNNDIWKDTQLC